MADDKHVGVSESPNQDSEKHEVEAWLRTISTTEKWRDSVGGKAGWKRFINEYKCEWNFLQGSVSVPLIPVNLIYSYVKTEIARLYFKDPWVTVNPKRIEDIGAAQIAEQILNYTWGEIDLKRQVKLALLEGLLVGHSWIKVGYAAEFGTVEAQPKEEKKGPGRPKKQAEIETSEFIKSENVFAYHVPYKDILFDPSATYPAHHNARWMAHKIVKPLRAIKESGIYEHTDDLKSSQISSDYGGNAYDGADSGNVKESFGKDVRSATLWEIYDLDNMKVLTVSSGCPYYLKQMDYPEYLAGGFPFAMLGFNPVPGEVFPLSDIAAQEPLVIEHQKIKAIELNHLKRWNRQIITEPDLFTPEEEAKFKDSIDGAIIKANGPIENKMFIPPYAPVQSDVYQIYTQNMQEWQIVSGQTSTDQGGQAKTNTRTLGELRMALQGGHARADEKVDVLEDFIAEIARKLLGIMQKKYDLPKITRIVGTQSVQKKIMGVLPQRPSAQPQMPGGQPNPVQDKSFESDFGFSWNRQDILGEMDVDVVAGSTIPMDREAQLEILEKLIPLLPAAGITPGSPAAKAYAREMMRLVGIQSVEAVMDLADQAPPQPPPKLMEVQAKVQAKQQETQVKIQGKLAEEKIKLQAMQEKMNMDRQKHHMGMQKDIISTLLQNSRKQQEPSNGI